MAEPEKLRRGRDKGRHTAEPKLDAAAPLHRRLVDRWKRRRAIKKRRLAAMSRRRRVGRRLALGGTWLLGLLAVIMVSSVVLFYTLSDVPRPESLPLPQVATILYSDGSVMARIGSVNRTIVSLDKVPTQVRWDILAAEDRHFYTDPGVSIKGTLRAALSDVTGGDTQGGSGITQQYAKNAYLSDSRTLSRKLKELAIAVKLTRDYSKDQILEFYLNTVYFGRNTYGIEAAARAYFNKDVSRLTTAEGAVLAALLRAPSYYDPAVNPSEAQARWKYVLDGMVATKHLTQAQEAATRFPKVAAPPKSGSGLGASGPTALIVQRVIAELDAHGINEDEIYARGLRIQTTIDRKAQAAALSAVHATFAHLTSKQKNLKNALVAVAPAGGVLAYYGGPNGKDYAGKVDYYDYAGLGSAAPGSSFKPYVLATALTQTLTKKPKKPVTIDSYVDGSYCVTVESTKVCNDPSDRGYSSSSVSVANAMKYSLNTTFDLMAQSVGPSNVAVTAHAAGISKTIGGKPTLVDADGKTSFGIGIGDYPVHPIDQAVGFATFADNGTSHSAYFVDKATASDGSVAYRHKNTSSRAMDPKVANDVTMTLEPVAEWSGVALGGGRTSAAKTGTEGILGDKNGNNSDAWTVGYTPQVSASVWVGSGNSTTPIYNAAGNPEYGRDLPGQAWKLFMDTYLAGKKDLPMASQQMIKGGVDTAPPPSTPAASTPTTAATSASPSPTFSVSTGFPTPSSAKPTLTPPPPLSSLPTPTGSCTGLLPPSCTSSPAPAP